jgi:SAM-dependent methyltransferase
MVPRVLELCAPNHIRSVVDVGCGLGTWLRVFRESGVEDIFGVDGEYVNRDKLEIPMSSFATHDLAQPLDLSRSFDLAISLEVAEHIAPEFANIFVQSLTRLAPIVLFSAAVPGQGGKHHVNEQWPEYWVAQFAAQRFVAVDCLRFDLLGHSQVEYWYQQNTVIFVDRERLVDFPELCAEFARCRGKVPAIVHPTLLGHWKEWGVSQSQAYWSLMSEQ